MSKPLSETHSTLWKNCGIDITNCHQELWFEYEKDIQSCTVDVAEHEALKKQLFEAVDNYGKLEAEVERLKKENAEQLMYAIHQAEKIGERRAMERVKQAISNSLTAYQVERKLGLGNTYGGEEEKR